MITINDFPDCFNIIPLPRNSKIPDYTWEKFQTEKFPRHKLNFGENHGNFAVICGKISHNLLILDLDFKEGKKNRENVLKILTEFQKNIPGILDTLRTNTPHGIHLYYYTKDFEETRHKFQNAGYNDKNKFTGSLKTKFKQILKGFDVLGNNGYALIPPSRINGLEYDFSQNKPVKYISKEDYEKIKTFLLLEKSIRIRKPFLDILNGKIEIEDQANKTGCDEFLYWKALYRECYNRLGLEPHELFKGLEANQPSFNKEKTETQLQYHPCTEKPFTNDKLAEMFPDYYSKNIINHTKEDISPKIKDSKKEKKKKVIKKKEFTEEEKQKFEAWLNLDEKKRYQDINEILKFNIIGEKELNNANLIFFLKLGDLLSKDLRNKINIHGDPSAGKSYVCDCVVHQLLPKEYILIIDGGSNKIFRYPTETEEEAYKIVYLREMKKDMGLIEDLKSIGDNDPIWQYVDFQKKSTITVKKDKVGQLTTYSFEYTQRDFEDRAWNLIPDQAYIQNEEVINFRLQCRRNKLQRHISGLKIKEKSDFVKNAIRYLMTKEKLNVIIPYSEKLKPIFSKKKIRVRRDVDKLPDLIEAITLFNQKNRYIFEFDNEKWIVAEFEDLRKAFEHGKDYFIKMSLNLDQVKQDILDFMEVEKEYTVKEIFDYIKKHHGFHENTIRNKLKDLAYNGYIEIEKQGKGTSDLYRKVKDYEKLELDISKIKDDIIEIVDLFKTNLSSLINEELEKKQQKTTASDEKRGDT